MSKRLVLLALLPALATGCKEIDCGVGTTQRDGICVPANETIGTAKCGPGTTLQGDSCAPTLAPAVCDPATTSSETDSAGVIRCVGRGGGTGCAARLDCSAPADGKHTICGQLYDFETMQPYADPGAVGTRCAAGATSGPCAIGVRAFDALMFATNPSATPPLATDPLYMDDCGRFRVAEIPVPTTGLVALGIDDATQGPGGLTNAVGVATLATANTSTPDLDGYIVRKSTTDAWVQAGAPNIGNGYYIPVFRGHRSGLDTVAGVTVTYGLATALPPTQTDVNRDFYFPPEATARTTLATANMTGANGTAVFSGATLTERYSGQGSLPANCRWDIHAGASTPGVVFIQVYRPINAGATCPL